MKVLLITFISILGLIIILLVLLYLTFKNMGKLPHNKPDSFLKNNNQYKGKYTVACIGASTVHGSISFNFVNELSRRCAEYRFINDGVNGSFAYNVLQRLGKVISCKPDYVVVLIGGNDVLANIYPRMASQNPQMKDLPKWPDRDCYTKNLVDIIQRLKLETSAKISLMSLSIAGENLSSLINIQIDLYNLIIKEIAEKENIQYIAFNEQLKKYLENKNHINGKDFSGKPTLMFKSIILHFILGYGFDRISKLNGFLLLTDGMHLNSKAGSIAADQIEAFIRNA